MKNYWLGGQEENGEKKSSIWTYHMEGDVGGTIKVPPSSKYDTYDTYETIARITLLEFMTIVKAAKLRTLEALEKLRISSITVYM